MTTFPRAPRLTKGAIVAVEPLSPLAGVIVFQYNPDGLRRSLSARAASQGGDRSETLRLAGPPQESIELTVELDAADQLERGSWAASTVGLHPQLAALEMLLYPKVARVALNAALARAGVIETVAPEAPLSLFVWGAKRVLPVRLAGLGVEEQAYDSALNPVRATLSLSLQVLSYSDLLPSNPGFGLFLAHQVAKEALAGMAGVSAVSGGLHTLRGLR